MTHGRHPGICGNFHPPMCSARRPVCNDSSPAGQTLVVLENNQTLKPEAWLHKHPGFWPLHVDSCRPRVLLWNITRRPFSSGRAAVGCSVSGVGEAIIRAGLARKVTAAAADTATDLDAACSAALEHGILQACLAALSVEGWLVGSLLAG
jgi:hypothetical protein